MCPINGAICVPAGWTKPTQLGSPITRSPKAHHPQALQGLRMQLGVTLTSVSGTAFKPVPKETATPIEKATFEFAGITLRTTHINGQPWFVASDAVKLLGLRHITKALVNCTSSAVLDYRFPGTKGRANKIVSEAGLYELILQSRKPKAAEFKRWVTQDVLPIQSELCGTLNISTSELVSLPSAFPPEPEIETGKGLPPRRTSRRAPLSARCACSSSAHP